MREIPEKKKKKGKKKKVSGKSCQNDLYKKSTVKRSIFYTVYLNIKHETLKLYH